MRSLYLIIISLFFFGCAGKYGAKTASIEARKTLEATGMNKVHVVPVTTQPIIKKPYFMTFTAEGQDQFPIIGVVGCAEGTGCEYRVFVDMSSIVEKEAENTKEELETDEDEQDSTSQNLEVRLK